MRRTILFVSISALVVVGMSGMAAADAPQRMTIPFAVSGIDRTSCGFPVVWSETGTFDVISFVDDNGVWRASITRWDGTEVDVNRRTGTSVSGSLREIDLETTDSVAVVGPVYSYPVPGYGNVLVQAGRFVLDLETGEWVFAAGRTDWESGNVAAWCAALA